MIAHLGNLDQSWVVLRCCSQGVDRCVESNWKCCYQIHHRNSVHGNRIFGVRWMRQSGVFRCFSWYRRRSLKRQRHVVRLGSWQLRHDSTTSVMVVAVPERRHLLWIEICQRVEQQPLSRGTPSKIYVTHVCCEAEFVLGVGLRPLFRCPNNVSPH